MKALITGGAGFIGHHVVKYLLETTGWDLTIVDRLDESGNLNRLAEIGAAKNPRVRFVFHDLRAPFNAQLAAQVDGHDYIVHMAAATHVDRSILQPMEFVLDNVVATVNVLDLARRVGCAKFIQFSTDEVFGPAPPGTAYREWDRYRSGNPYAATKAGAEELALSYQNTYGVPVVVTHTMNVFGERQLPEKFIPLLIKRIRDGEPITIHSDKSRTKAGSRFYIHADHVADAVSFLLMRGQPGEKYNIVGQREVDNLELATLVAGIQGRPLNYEMVDFHSSRPGHDLRYALDGARMAEMGWRPPAEFEPALQQTVEWTLNNPRWLLEQPAIREVA